MTDVNLVSKLESSFSFRTVKETGYKRPTVEVSYDAPNAAGIVAILATPETNTAKMVVEHVQSLLTGYIRGLVDEDTAFNQATLDALIAEGKITLDNIANLPATERNMVGKDDLESFAKDYLALMPTITGKTEAKIASAAGLFVSRFKSVAGDNAVLAVLQDQLAVFIDKAGEEVFKKHEKVITFLGKKLEELLAVKITADSL